MLENDYFCIPNLTRRTTQKVASNPDPGEPYLLFDLYPFDLGEKPDFAVPQRTDVDGDGDSDYIGGILKATDGIAYSHTDWFITNFKRLKEAGLRFRGGYHYLQFLRPGAAQADYYHRIVTQAGGWEDDVIMPIVDVESGGERSANSRATGQQIVDCTSAFAERIKSLTGRRCMLYSRGSLRDHSITSKMNCDCVWNPSYTERMVTNGLVGTLPNGAKAPWKLEEIVMWQYGGDGVGDRDTHKLPLEIPGFGKIDLSVCINGNQKPTLDSIRSRLI